jgi:two-component system chemotaxis family response regulator WspR
MMSNLSQPTMGSFHARSEQPAIDSPSGSRAGSLTSPPDAPPEAVVLLVDDQMIVARAVRQLFAQDPGISFHYCADASQALAYAEELRPTVILQDLVMPGTSGLELVQKYRSTPATAEIPIIVLSAKEDAVTKSQAFAEGANDYLVKLPDRIELVARVRYHSKAYRALSALRDQASRDGLTGVWNRKTIFDRLAQELARVEREHTCMAIVMVDLDKFKSINDSLGHPAGDAVLQQASRRLITAVRSYDLVGRYGGEEFLLVLPNCERDQATKLGERLRQAIANVPMNIEGRELPVTCSLGVACASASNSDLAALVRAADGALYRAKQEGRNCIRVAAFPEIDLANDCIRA